MTQATEITLDGRIVNGHPMARRAVMKKLAGAQVETALMAADGVTPVTETYVAIAVAKTPGVDWKLTPWGQEFVARAAADFPAGQSASPLFSWKVADGDSAIPNKKLKKPCDREGWAGHWIIHASTRLFVKCYHTGKYDPTQQIQDENAIKCGDYGRLLVGLKGNTGDTPGVYVNPMLFSLDRAGQQIITDSGPDAAAVFGGAAPQATPAAQAAAPAPAAAAIVAPAPDFLNAPAPAPAAAPAPVEVLYVDSSGGQFTEAVLVAAGYTVAQVHALPRAN